MATTLAIDYGSKNIGLALVNHEKGQNKPLFAGSIKYNNFILKKKVQPRADIRRTRRTRKTKQTRLRRLRQSLIVIDISLDKIPDIVRFCRRRGYRSLWENEEESKNGSKADKDEIQYRFSREKFFEALDLELQTLLPPEQQAKALGVCEKVLNLEGDRFQEIRLIRIENRGVSRCAWKGCDRVTPRRHNAVRDPLSQFVFTVYKTKIKENPKLLTEIEAMLDRVAALAKRYRNAKGPDPKKERKALMKKIRAEFKMLKDLTETPELVTGENNTWSYIKKNLENIVKSQNGRNRYCREHSAEYVEHLLRGQPIPFKDTLTERDIFSRREEILFQKLWRYIQARILPLAPKGIDRLVVERTAFDLLAGTRKQRDKLSDQAVEEMYQEGPRLGYKNDREMLKDEFGGLCVYCGKPSDKIFDREHILPRSNFFFDSYINIVPACPRCNSNLKGKRMLSASGLRIHDEAYKAYSDYLKSKYKQKPPHLFQTVKKGILNLMRQPDRVWEAERYLALIANHFSEIVQTQRGPRPLARYLCEKLRLHQDLVPDVSFFSGRHTEIWRRAAYPDFDKTSDKINGSVVNHALDALLLACKFPSVSALEARHLRSRDLFEWKEAVRKLAPNSGPDGIPELPLLIDAVTDFEQIERGNYVSANLSMFNWNRKNSGTHKQDPFGWNIPKDCPVKRVKAAELVDDLVKVDKGQGSPERRKEKAGEIIDLIVHPNLRKHLHASAVGEKPGERAAEALRQWLKKSIGNSIFKSEFSNHPGDQAREQDLKQFAGAEDTTIPAIIGIKMLFPARKGNVDLIRQDCRTGGICHRYLTNPSNACLVLAYPKNNKAGADRKKPLMLGVRQSGEVRTKSGRRYFQPIPEGPLNGRVLGDRSNNQSRFIETKEWKKSLNEYLGSCNLAEYGIITQGCVVQYDDGKERFVRNFSPDYGFKTSILRDVTGVRRSPLCQTIQPMVKL